MQNVLYFIEEKKLSSLCRECNWKNYKTLGFFHHSAELGQGAGKAVNMGNTKEIADLFHVKSLFERSF